VDLGWEDVWAMVDTEEQRAYVDEISAFKQRRESDG
jgi:hypothetical protein